jgi:hypothetical protein
MLTYTYINIHIWAVLEFELRTSHLLSSCCTTGATPPVHFALFGVVVWVFFFYFDIGSCFLHRLVCTMVILFYIFCHSWDGRHTPPCPVLIEMGSYDPLPRLISSSDLLDLSIPSSWDYKHEPLGPSLIYIFKSNFFIKISGC